ncbi:mechanosensitive ion channel domain-containing protein [Winogradskyella sp. SYSU M77433]|uniref:mechanosensitive ion channel family protein n=1 Tax=Winogradskyella sp. SYSU M77433 TaxID=3042722 RepID=UPI00248148C7|nr:mechanosensitive ion channel domain-containing protein [Winogradskyella sp. SYSU M77433]MDH7912502.1 mechanosensitive ion channel [Winogradskyella sp. SYSU M77433]
MKNTKLIFSIALIVIIFAIKPIANWVSEQWNVDLSLVVEQRRNFVIVALAWFLIILLRRIKRQVLKHYDITKEDNLKSRKLYTQFNILEKVIVFVIILTSIGLILLSFESIREIGVGIFASAGLAGIILGLSAQKVFGALMAGIQIALTQPFRIDDAVVVEGEWGWIEEINLTYVVVRIWDKRRLVLPSTYFLEKPFQNWTRSSADIIGTVFLYTDYNVPFDALREELKRILDNTDLWDKNVQVLQVTDSKEYTVETRILVSARNSPTAWDLRVHVREKMIDFIRENYPESLPRTRVVLTNPNTEKEA